MSTSHPVSVKKNLYTMGDYMRAGGDFLASAWHEQWALAMVGRIFFLFLFEPEPVVCTMWYKSISLFNLNSLPPWTPTSSRSDGSAACGQSESSKNGVYIYIDIGFDLKQVSSNMV